MAAYSTREAAKRLGISMATINRYIASGKIPLPPLTKVGGVTIRLWTDKDLAAIRAILATFTNGRRTRHRKKKH
jgi:excisionase family DNA binding protein